MSGHETEGTLKFARADGTDRVHNIKVYNSSTQASNYMKFQIHAGGAGTGALTDNVLYLRGDGNVGIGTTSPRANLDVYGDLIVAKADNTGRITTGAVQTNPTTRLSNYVIGNSTTVNNAGSTPVYAPNLAFTPNAINGGVLWATEGYGEPTLYGGDLVLYGGDINASGNNGTGAGQYYAGHTYIQGGIAFTGSSVGGSGRTYNGSIYFQTGVDDTTSSTNTERYIRMSIKPGGDIGIGTTNPGAKLHIYTGSTSKVGLSLDRYASGNYRTDIHQNAYGPDFRVGYAGYTPESILYLKRRSDGSKEVQINGNVGIGTTSPGATLDVNGTIRTSTTSTNIVTGSGSDVTINSGTPTTFASVSITTRGNKVLIICSGDLQPANGTTDWLDMVFYRGTTAIGKVHRYHPGTAGSTNQVFAMHVIDQPSAGTYTYYAKGFIGSGGTFFGENDNPQITAIEFL